MAGKKIDLTGHRFGRLVVICEAGRAKNRQVLWKCRCDCGNGCVVSGNNLRRGHTNSCGCLIIKHDLIRKYCRLYKAIFNHFEWIRLGHSGYSQWVLDSRYSDDTDGVAKFCYDLIALQPEMCKRYENDKSLDLDKDNNEQRVFCPECIVFRNYADNRSKTSNNLKLLDGTRFVDLVGKVGVKPVENRRRTKQYGIFYRWFKQHNGEGHPELIKRANELIALFTKTLKLLELRDDVRRFASDAGIPLRSTQQ